MKKYTPQALEKALAALEICQGDNIYLHCGIHAFGIIEGNEEQLFKDLRHFLGSSSTIAVPTFTLWLDNDKAYTMDTPSQRMGRMAEHIRLLPGSVRSKCPMHNHAAIGPLANLLKLKSGAYSTGPHSDFEIFYEHNFKNLFLGCKPRDTGTYLIHIESLAGVPYREWVSLERKVCFKADEIKTVKINYCSRKETFQNRDTDSDIRIKVNLAVYEELLLEHKILRSTPLSYGTAYAGRLVEMQDFLLSELKKTPLMAVE